MLVDVPFERADLGCMAILALSWAAVAVSIPWTVRDWDVPLLPAAALRVAAGAAPYRDFETYISPGPIVLQWLAFAGLGQSIVAVQALFGLMLGVLGAAIFAMTRSLGVARRGALLASAAALPLAIRIWPAVSVHWFGAAAMTIAFLGLARDWRRVEPATNLLQGALVGAIPFIQVHKGVIASAIVALYLLVDLCIMGPPERRLRPLLARLVWIWAGWAMTLALGSVAIAAWVGAREAADGLLWGPILQYRLHPSGRNDPAELWGVLTSVAAGPLRLANRRPLLAFTVQLSSLVTLAILAVAIIRAGADVRWRRRLLLAATFLSASFAVHGYRITNWVYQAMVVPALAVAIAICVARWLDRASVLRAGHLHVQRRIVTWAALIACAWWAIGFTVQVRQATPYRADTAFGGLATSTREEALRIEAAVARARESGARALYCHPYCAELNLITGLPNPVPFDLLRIGMNGPQTYADILTTISGDEGILLAFGPPPSPDPPELRDDVLEWIKRRAWTTPTDSVAVGKSLLYFSPPRAGAVTRSE